MSEYWDGHIPWITASSLHDFYIRDSARRVTHLGIENGTRLMPKDTILFVVRGMSLKTEFRVGISRCPVAFGQDCKALIPKEGIDPLFLANVLRGRADEILGLADEASHGTGRLATDALKRFKIWLPPLDEQKQIAHILGTLDDKIELNQQMNRTLEGIARALFKSWFIDFDPVRAKLDGRQPSGMDAETAALFPDAFEDGGAIGPIPKGWQQCNLGDFLNLKRGYDLPKRLREEGNIPIISSSGFSGYHSTPKVKAPGVATGRYGTVGQVFFIEEDFWPLNTTLYVQDFKGNNPKIAYYILEQIDFNVYADKAAVPGVNRNHVHQEKIVAPPKQIQERFFKLLEPTWQQQTVNEQEAGALQDLRNVLLPKLLSGEICIRKVDNILEKVA